MRQQKSCATTFRGSDMAHSTWPTAPVSQLFYVKGRIGWRGLKRRDFTRSGPYLITGMHIQDDGSIDWASCFRIPQSKFEESPEIIAEPGDIVITKDGTIGKVAFIERLPGPTSLNSHLFLVRPHDDGRVDRHFAKHAFRSRRFHEFIEQQRSGSTLSGLGERKFVRFQFPTPPLPEQRQIAEILDTIDEAIRKTETIIAKLKQVKQGLLRDLLTRGIDDNGELRDPERHPEQFKDSPLGQIPKEWEVASTADVCSHIVDCPHSTPVYVETGIPCIRTADMMPGRLLLNTARKVTEATFLARTERLVPIEGDIIYSREGERLGIASPVGAERVCLAQRVMHLRPGPRTDPRYLVWAMNAPPFYRQAAVNIGATTSPHVNLADIRRFNLARPPFEEQRHIGEAMHRHALRVAEEQRESQKLRVVKQGLMEDLLTGRVRVTALLDGAAE